jgi:hypothetical protein
MLKHLSLGGLFLAVSLAVPAAAPAVTQIPPDGGVRGRLVDGTIVSLRFSPAAFREVAGRRVVIACTQLGPETLGISGVGIGSEGFRMPERRRVVRRFVGKGYDYCTLRLGRKRLVTFATSDRGAVLVDEQYQTLSLVAVLTTAPDDSGHRYRTPAEFAAAVPFPIAPLASPADTPPPGSVGYYSDGALHAAAVVVSAAGRRLFVEADADDVLRTNVAKYLSARFL